MSVLRSVLILSALACCTWPVRGALAQQPVADCDGWMSIADWPRRAIFVDATATLEQLQNGVFVSVDTSQASSFAPAGGEVLLGAPWSFTLSQGATYRVRLSQVIYDHATGTPNASAKAAWAPADTHPASGTGAEFTCASGRPSVSISPPSSVVRAQNATLQPTISSASSWTPPLTFALVSGPLAMSIDESSGELQWTPTAADVDRRSVIVALESEGEILDLIGFELPITSQ